MANIVSFELRSFQWTRIIILWSLSILWRRSPFPSYLIEKWFWCNLIKLTSHMLYPCLSENLSFAYPDHCNGMERTLLIKTLLNQFLAKIDISGDMKEKPHIDPAFSIFRSSYSSSPLLLTQENLQNKIVYMLQVLFEMKNFPLPTLSKNGANILLTWKLECTYLLFWVSLLRHHFLRACSYW